ncbi:MAG: NAD(P)H-hydrate dehydratase [Candidatus Nanopelagicales bacterium]
MKSAYSVAEVRAAEARLMAKMSTGALMQRAVAGLTSVCVDLLVDRCASVNGTRVVLLVGTGNNGGDTLWCGSRLADRGANVTAITFGSTWHQEGGRALLRSGGRLIAADSDECRIAIDTADLVLDGILGIGGTGSLRGAATTLAAAATASSAVVVAVDVPSGVDSDTGAVADQDAVVDADVTVTFGVLKPGLVVAPGALQVGELTLVDIGLRGLGDPVFSVVDEQVSALHLPAPGPTDDKYSRGVVGVVAGSPPYPGAAVLCTGSARLGGTGMVRYAGSAAEGVAARWPDVVLAHEGPAKAGKVQAWAVGPGAGTDDAAKQRLSEALTGDAPVLIDADALTLVAGDEGLRTRIRDRADAGKITVMTPHAGEFARLGFALPEGAQADRVGQVRDAAAQLGVVLLLKGSHTLVASPDGTVFANTLSDAALATAGSGDVLSGLAGSMLASEVARDPGLAPDGVAELIACAALVHGLAGQLAAAGGRPVTAIDVLEHLPGAIATIRGGRNE